MTAPSVASAACACIDADCATSVPGSVRRRRQRVAREGRGRDLRRRQCQFGMGAVVRHYSRAAQPRAWRAARKVARRNCGRLVVLGCVRVGQPKAVRYCGSPETLCAPRCTRSTRICSARKQDSRNPRACLEDLWSEVADHGRGGFDRLARNRGTAGHGALVGGHGGCSARRAGACTGARTFRHECPNSPSGCSAADWIGSGSRWIDPRKRPTGSTRGSVMIELIVADRCTDCGDCIAVCPTNVLDPGRGWPAGSRARRRLPDLLHVRALLPCRRDLCRARLRPSRLRNRDEVLASGPPRSISKAFRLG